jgi:hypothetical protein
MWSSYLMHFVFCWNTVCELVTTKSNKLQRTPVLFFFFSFLGWGGVRLSPLGTWATVWPTLPALDDRWRWWVWSSRWNENWQRKLKYSEKLAPLPLCPPQIPHDLTWVRTRAAVVGSRRLTAWAMARPKNPVANSVYFILGHFLQSCYHSV